VIRRLARPLVTAPLLALAVAAGCNHRVSVNSNPPGARAYVDQQFVGVTPTTFSETSGFGKEYEIRLEKDGYRTLTVKEKQRANLGYLLLSILTCGIGVLWSFTLEDRYDYSLERT